MFPARSNEFGHLSSDLVVAVEVKPEIQRRGLGTLLFCLLIVGAHRRGIAEVIGLVAVENLPFQGMLKKLRVKPAEEIRNGHLVYLLPTDLQG